MENKSHNNKQGRYTMAGSGRVKMAGYKTGGAVPYRGMKNKRKAKKAKIKAQEIALRRHKQAEEEERQRQDAEDYGYEARDNYRGNNRR